MTGKMTLAEYKAYLENKSGKKKSKYKNERTELKGRSFDSKGEANHFYELTLRERAGEIRDIKTQEHIYLSPARIDYICDFSFVDCKTGAREWAEYKGFETPEWRLKRRLWGHFGPGKLTIHYPPQSGKRPEVIWPKKTGADSHTKCHKCGADLA